MKGAIVIAAAIVAVALAHAVVKSSIPQWKLGAEVPAATQTR